MAIWKANQTQFSSNSMSYALKFPGDGVGDRIHFGSMGQFTTGQINIAFLTGSPVGTFDIFNQNLGQLSAYQLGLTIKANIVITLGQRLGTNATITGATFEGFQFWAAVPLGAIEIQLTTTSTSEILFAATFFK